MLHFRILTVIMAVGLACMWTANTLPAAAAEISLEAPVTLREQVDHAVEQVKPALVRIRVVFARYSEGREIKSQASGSGVIVSEDGYVVTNHHVAGRATRLFCTLSTREEIEAELIGTDPLTDIAVIKLMAEDRTFPTAQFGDSDQVRVGDHVLAMGSPMALSQSVTLGIVSNTEMIMPRMFGRSARLTLDGEDVGSLVKWIGHDADIYGGNSGGPLVNLNGEIVGINEISMALGGAIPGNLARSVAGELIDHGSVRRAWLGLEIQPLLKNSPVRRGALVGTVIDGSPADAAGIQPGDLIVRVADQDITVEFGEELPGFNQLAADLPIGEETEVKVLRNGEELGLTVVPEERQQVAPREFELRPWGVTARNISLMMAKELKRDTQDGVMVTSVRPGGPAGDAKPQIQRDDIIVAVNDAPVRSIEELARMGEELTRDASEPVPVIVNFERKTGDFITVVKVGITELRDPGREAKRAWLPVETQVLTRDIAEQMNREDLNGFRITEVYRHSTAEAAGLQVGDIIYAVDGERLRASRPEDFEELRALIRQYSIGLTAELAILRKGEEIVVPVELAREPLVSREMARYEDSNFEFTVRDITFHDIAREQWVEEQQGVLVEDVKPGSWAALGQLNTGDLLTEINYAQVNTVDDVRQRMDEIEKEEPKFVVMRILRGIQTVYLEFEPKWETVEDMEEE